MIIRKVVGGRWLVVTKCNSLGIIISPPKPRDRPRELQTRPQAKAFSFGGSGSDGLAGSVSVSQIIKTSLKMSKEHLKHHQTFSSLVEWPNAPQQAKASINFPNIPLTSSPRHAPASVEPLGLQASLPQRRWDVQRMLGGCWVQSLGASRRFNIFDELGRQSIAKHRGGGVSLFRYSLAQVNRNGVGVESNLFYTVDA